MSNNQLPAPFMAQNAYGHGASPMNPQVSQAQQQQYNVANMMNEGQMLGQTQGYMQPPQQMQTQSQVGMQQQQQGAIQPQQYMQQMQQPQFRPQSQQNQYNQPQMPYQTSNGNTAYNFSAAQQAQARSRGGPGQGPSNGRFEPYGGRGRGDRNHGRGPRDDRDRYRRDDRDRFKGRNEPRRYDDRDRRDINSRRPDRNGRDEFGRDVYFKESMVTDPWKDFN